MVVVVVVQWLACGLREVPESNDWLAPGESSRLGTLRFPKRRNEMRLARWTAKHAIARVLGQDEDAASLAQIEIRSASSGAPEPFVDERPAPVSVSLTDRADWSVCAVGPARLAVGCDLELVEERSAAFVCDWFTTAEQDLVFAAEPGEPRHVLANLVWSAKESAVKVLETGFRRATRSVEVDLVGSDGTGGTDGWTPLVVRTEEGATLPGWWRRYGDFLLTLAADADCDPPTSLDDPPRLASANPTHAWMTDS